jgi:hypothetical protein
MAQLLLCLDMVELCGTLPPESFVWRDDDNKSVELRTTDGEMLCRLDVTAALDGASAAAESSEQRLRDSAEALRQDDQTPTAGGVQTQGERK